MADLLSQTIWVASFLLCNNSLKTFLIHTASHEATTVATYSASVEDRVTMGCFFDAHATASDPRLKIYPDVLFLSLMEPGKSLLVYPISSKFKLYVYEIPKLVVPATYIRILFHACQRLLFEVSMNLEIKLTANITLGMVVVKYIRLPMSLLYRVGSTYDPSSYSLSLIPVAIGVAVGLQFNILNLFNTSFA
jgi:hypothetical protein